MKVKRENELLLKLFNSSKENNALSSENKELKAQNTKLREAMKAIMQQFSIADHEHPVWKQCEEALKQQ